MKLYLSATFIVTLVFSLACQQPATNNSTVISTGNTDTPGIITVQLIADNITSPVGVVSANDGSGRLFIIQQNGYIRIIKNGKLLDAPFLNLTSQLDKLPETYSEKGLLGLAFHPQFKTNGKFYVYYTAPPANANFNSQVVVAEYKASTADPDKAEPNGRIILRLDHPQANHNGGQLAFGPDGYLYIGIGDGGGGGDKHGEKGNGQNTNTLLAKILRIDVNTDKGYKIPPDNPFVNKNAKPEIWAYGLRNPWRFSFDSKTGQLFCGDVGQDKYEEVDIIEKGKNYGWRIMEGYHCYNPETNCDTTGLTPPITEYSHETGNICIIGGYVYRGQQIARLQGNYVFGDWKGQLFLLLPEGKKWQRINPKSQGFKDDFTINSFGQDEAGELYIAGQTDVGANNATGSIYKITNWK